MAMTLQELRDAAGGLSTFSDEELAQATYPEFQRYYPKFEDYAKAVGYDTGDNFKRGLRIAGRNTLAEAGGVGALAADAVGATGARDAALGYAREQSGAAMREGRRSDDVDNFREDPGAFISAGLGQALGYAGPSVVSGGLGALGAARLGLSAVGGAVAGGYTANVGQSAGGIYNELAEQGRYEPGRALGYGAAAAALDTVPEALGVGRLAKGSTGGLGRRVLGAAGVGAATEAPTEVGQSVIERQAAYKALTGDEAENEYRNAAALGALGGGAFGAATGLKRRAEHVPVAPLEQSPDLLNPSPSAPLMLGYDPSVAPGDLLYADAQGNVGPDARDVRETQVQRPSRPYTDAEAISDLPVRGLGQRAAFDPDEPYSGAAEFSPTELPVGPFPQPATETQIPSAAPVQRTLDGGYDLGLDDNPPDAPQDNAAPQDTRTRDIAAAYPTAQVQAGPQYTPMSILSQIAGITGNRRDAFTVKTAIGLSRSIGKPNAPTTFLAEQKANLDLALKKLDKQVDGESNRWTPEEYAQKRQVIENRYKDLEAAAEVAGQYDRALTNAYADEAAQRPAPGATSAPAAPSTGTEQQIRESNALQQQTAATADVDARVAGADQQRAQGERATLLAKVLDDPATRNPVGRFTAELKRAGIRETSLTAEEADKIGKFVDAREAFNAPATAPAEPAPEPVSKAPSAPNTFDPYKPPKAPPAPAPAPAPQPAPKAPAKAEKPLAPKAPARDPELIELRKRESVLRALLDCMA